MKTKITAEGWHVIDGDLISGWVEQNKKLDHDEHLIPIAVSNIPEGGVVIDCGANIGSHSVAYAKKVGTHGTLIAIEAGQMAFECLFENAKKFEGKTLLINAAICDIHAGRAIHTVNPTNVGGSTVGGETNGEIVSNEVRTITLDGLQNDADGLQNDAYLKRIDFIKIDCEGFEYKILQGARGILKRFKPILLIEMNSFRLLENGASYKDIYDFLLSLNYSWRIVQPELKGGDVQYDIMCWPNKIQISQNLLNG